MSSTKKPIQVVQYVNTADKRSYVHIAERYGAGYVELVHDQERPDFMRISVLYVDPLNRKQGVGSALLSVAEETVARFGVAKIGIRQSGMDGWVREWLQRVGYARGDDCVGDLVWFCKRIGTSALCRAIGSALISMCDGDVIKKGLCDYIGDKLDHSYNKKDIKDVLCDTWKQWSKFSGEPNYPIPCPEPLADVLTSVYVSPSITEREAAAYAYHLYRKNLMSEYLAGIYLADQLELKRFLIKAFSMG